MTATLSINRSVRNRAMAPPFARLEVSSSSDDEDENAERSTTTLSCLDMNYSIDMNTNIGSKVRHLGRPRRRQILFDVSCTFQSGMNAILGERRAISIHTKISFAIQVPLGVVSRRCSTFSRIVKIGEPARVECSSTGALGHPPRHSGTWLVTSVKMIFSAVR